MIAFARRTLLAAAFALSLLPATAGAAPADEARALFEKFVAAQNAHDGDAVRSMLWDGPEMLWFTRGVEVRGADTVVARFREYYQGIWHLDPDMTKFEATVLGDGLVQILVPIIFTRGNADHPAQQARILISQTYVRQGSGWRVASILPLADTQLK